MIKIGDTVKIIKPTQDAEGDPGELREYIKIGTVCTVINIDKYEDGTTSYECIPKHELHYFNTGFHYLEDEIEKGHLEWVKDE